MQVLHRTPTPQASLAAPLLSSPLLSASLLLLLLLLLCVAFSRSVVHSCRLQRWAHITTQSVGVCVVRLSFNTFHVGLYGRNVRVLTFSSVCGHSLSASFFNKCLTLWLPCRRRSSARLKKADAQTAEFAVKGTNHYAHHSIVLAGLNLLLTTTSCSLHSECSESKLCVSVAGYVGREVE